MRRMIAWAAPVALIAGCSPAAQTSRTLIRCEFSNSAQGWVVSGDTRPDDAIFTPTGGHPGGSITGIDEALGETWYFLAPPEVLRELPKAINGSISYSLKQSGSIISLFDDDVVILGPSGRLSYRFPTAPGTEWTDFSVRLSASAGWTWNWNQKASQAQMVAVLTAPTLLQIRGEYVTGDDMGSLDNFVLRGAP
jgi:Laminin B (Domain IV)